MDRRLASLFAVTLALAGCSAERGHIGDGDCDPGCTLCDAERHCLDCTPGQNGCGAGAVFTCNPDGTLGSLVKTCEATERCVAGECASACDIAASTRSYIGCDYWPVTTLTSSLDPYFDFAVAVANPLTVADVTQSAPAHVQVWRGKDPTPIVEKEVRAGAVETILLPWVTELSQNGSAGSEQSILATGGAYHLVSDLPVVVYQFNPLQYEKPATRDCLDQPYRRCESAADCNAGDECLPILGDLLHMACQNTRTCHSLTGDASILLPAPTLRNEYLVIARQTTMLSRTNHGDTLSLVQPGFMAVVGTADGTSVTVDYSAYTEGGAGVTPMEPGRTATYRLDKGDVLQVASRRDMGPCAATSSEPDGTAVDTYCDLGPRFDLTGTRVTSDHPVAVFGGHACTFVPYDRWACDHLEEQMVPLESWGQKVIVVQTEPQVAHEPNVWRVVSGSEANLVTFDPPVHDPVMLGRFEYLEFAAEGGFLASATGRIAVAQFMVGQNYGGVARLAATAGDPAFGLGVNVEQLRNSYDFLTPPTFVKEYVNVVAPMGAMLELDGAPLAGTVSPIGGTGYGYLRASIGPGAHHLRGADKFGITVSGVAPYTAFLYVGGQELNDVPIQ